MTTPITARTGIALRRSLAAEHGLETLLAIDPGSHRCGVALFAGGQLVRTGLLRARGGRDFITRMEDIRSGLDAWLAAGPFVPDLVAIEDVGLGGMRQNIRNLATMSETRGYLMAVVRTHWKEVPLLDVPGLAAKKGVGAPLKRVEALVVMTRYARATAKAAKIPLPASEDECAAVCIGHAAFLVTARAAA